MAHCSYARPAQAPNADHSMPKSTKECQIPRPSKEADYDLSHSPKLSQKNSALTLCPREIPSLCPQCPRSLHAPLGYLADSSRLPHCSGSAPWIGLPRSPCSRLLHRPTRPVQDVFPLSEQPSGEQEATDSSHITQPALSHESQAAKGAENIHSLKTPVAGGPNHLHAFQRNACRWFPSIRGIRGIQGINRGMPTKEDNLLQEQ